MVQEDACSQLFMTESPTSESLTKNIQQCVNAIVLRPPGYQAIGDQLVCAHRRTEARKISQNGLAGL